MTLACSNYSTSSFLKPEPYYIYIYKYQTRYDKAPGMILFGGNKGVAGS